MHVFYTNFAVKMNSLWQFFQFNRSTEKDEDTELLNQVNDCWPIIALLSLPAYPCLTHTVSPSIDQKNQLGKQASQRAINKLVIF